MDNLERGHTKWEWKYHVVFIPKCRRRTLYGELRPHLGEVFRKLAARTECRVEERHLMVDHVHMLVSITPRSTGTGSAIRRPALLGQRVLRVDRGTGRGNPRVHQEPGKDQEKEDMPGANEPV